MKKDSLLSPFLLLFALIAVSLLLIGLTNKFILTVNFYERNGEPISGIPDMSAQVYERVKSAIYLYAAVYLVIKVLVITIILATGLYFFGTDVSFTRLLRVVILCEFVFLVPAAVKVFWFWPDRNSVDLITWQNFYFLSAASIYSDPRPAMLLPLQTLNVFEVAYWFLLAGGIEKITCIKFDKALKTVCLFYIPAVFVWVIFVVYLTVVYFPQSF